MATLATKVSGAGTRKAIGEAVLGAAKVLDARPVRARLAGFAKAHQAFVRAADKVAAAEAVRDAAHAAVAAADVAQDGAVDALVLALVAAGAPRMSPLKGLSNLSASDLKDLGTAKEARELQRVAVAIAKRGGATPALRRSAKAAGAAAAAVLKAVASVGPREKLYQESLVARDALSQPWETALAYLKRAARVAEDDGATGLFEALFQRRAEAPKPRAKPAKAPPKG